MLGFKSPRPIHEDDDLSTFDSGEPSLDEYLRKRALANHVQGVSRCYVTTRSDRVVGYYALAAGSVQRAEMPSAKMRQNVPEQVPVILLSRLAVDRKEQGCGLGAGLLRDAILRMLQVADQVGVRALLVHALHEDARRFYARFDFQPSPTDPLHLLLTVKDPATRSAAGNSGS